MRTQSIFVIKVFKSLMAVKAYDKLNYWALAIVGTSLSDVRRLNSSSSYTLSAAEPSAEVSNWSSGDRAHVREDLK